MNDRFSAQLRQHLVDSANERPAEGQLAMLIEHVDATAQRQPLVARLTWMPGRIGPVPTVTFRYGLIAVALTLVTVVAALLVGASSRPSTVFEGTWTSTDAPDGSTQFLIVGAGNFPIVQYVDEFATGQGCVNDAIKRFTADGTGTIVGNRMGISFPNGGGCGSEPVGVPGDDLTYDAATDRIVGATFTWTRVPSGAGPTLRPLATGPLASMVPATIPPELQACVDVSPGETYVRNVGALSLTLTIPAAATFGWQVPHDYFNLATSCMFGGPISIDASIVDVVYATCETEATVQVGTAADAVAALTNAQGFDISEPTDLTLGGHAATRFEVAFDTPMCFDEVRLWNEATVARGSSTIIYIVDVEGLALGITITNWNTETPPAQVAEAESIVASLQAVPIGPLPTTSATTPRPDDGCIQFDDGGAYTAPAGPVTLTATIPDGPDTYWNGLRDEFHIQRAPCLLGSPLSIESSIVTGVSTDTCIYHDWSIVEVATAAEAAAALAAQAGSDASEPSNLTIDGNPAVRLEVSVPYDSTTTPCESVLGTALWQTPGGPVYNIDPGSIWTVYLVDVNGSILAVTASRDKDAEAGIPTLRQEIDAILGSLQIEP